MFAMPATQRPLRFTGFGGPSAITISYRKLSLQGHRRGVNVDGSRILIEPPQDGVRKRRSP